MQTPIRRRGRPFAGTFPSAPRAGQTGCLLIVALLAVLFLQLGAAQAQAAFPSHVHARLVMNQDSLVAGQSALLAVPLRLDAGWHVQSAHPLDPTLIAARLTVSPIAGVTVEATRFPKGEELPVPAGVSGPAMISVYQDGDTILVPLKVAANAAPGERTITLTLRVQACNDQTCMPPETIPLTLQTSVLAVGTATKPTDAGVFAAAERQAFAPESVPASATMSASTGSAPAATVNPSAGDVTHELALIESRAYRPAKEGDDSGTSILSAILLGLIGGLILNIMPCVLPVIPLKVLSLVHAAHGDRRLAALHSLAFAAGVITLFVALGLALRATASVYGGQFQSPAVVLTTAMIVLAFGLSMLGVWTIQTPQAAYAIDKPRGGYLGSFSTGLLATILATPCSAPFLGTTIPYALSHPAPVTTLVFGVIGLGMASPYIVLAAFPKLLAKMPKAGRWTELVKEAVGIAMIAVALYLILLAPMSTWPWALAGGVLLAYVCWAWGRIPSHTMAGGTVWAIRAGAVICGVAAGVGLWDLATRPPATGWQPFSIAALDKGLADGRPVVVDWTAAWCINCKAVEARSLRPAAVQKAFADAHALRLRADITSDNPVAEKLLDKLGSRAIPVLAIFSPAHPLRPVVLRDLFSPGDVESAVAGAR